MTKTQAPSPALRQALEKAKIQPVAFAFAPSVDLLLADPRKKLDALLREARAEAKGARIATGTLTLEGNTLHVSPEKDIPQLDTLLRKALKAMGKEVDVAIAVGADVPGEAAPAEPGDIPPDMPAPTVDPDMARALSRAEAVWEKSRAAAIDDLKRLIAAIEAAAKRDPALAEAGPAARGLAGHFTPFDATLGKLLRGMAATAAEEDRARLAQGAARLAQAHRARIDSEFFRAVDSNGFVETNIRGRLLGALTSVDNALPT